MAYGPTYFRFVDPANLSTVRLDLNSTTGWMLARGLDLGIVTTEKTWLMQPPYDGATLASSYRPPVRMKVPLLMTPQASTSAMKTLYEALVTELDRTSNAIEFRPVGESTSWIIDTYRADIPSLMKGDFAPMAFVLKQTTTILTLEIDRAPQLRQAGTYI